MGETIRFLMVAVFVIISVVRLGPEKVSAQGTSGFDIPDSLRGIFADTAESMVDKARAAAGSQPQNVAPPPGFTSSFDDQRASPRVGGPTTDPTSARDSSWLTGPTASGSSRPTTDPYRSTYQGVSPPGSTGTTLVDQVGVRQQPGVIATVSGTQDPLSSEAQMMTLPPRDPNPNAVQQSMPTASGSSRGFGSLPRGVQLPSTYSAQGQTQGAPSTYGSEFGVAGSTWPTGSASNPVFGPPTAQEANFDASLYNSRSGSAAQSFNQGSRSVASGQEVLPPGNYGRTSVSGASTSGGSGLSGSGLGMPATDPGQATQTLPSTWTYEQIAQLGRMFGIPPTDPRMSDKAFVNGLYAQWREYENKQASIQSPQTAADALAGSAASSSGWSTNGVNVASPFSIPQSSFPGGATVAENRLASRTGTIGAGTLNAGTLNAGKGDTWGSGTASPSERPDVDPRLSQKDIDGLPPGAYSYDKYDNPIDKQGYILNRFGERVDADEFYELTLGKKRRQDEERLGKASTAAIAGPPSSLTISPSDRLDSTGFTSGQAAPSLRFPGVDPSTVVNRPSVPGGDGGLGKGNQIPSADQAGIGGTTKAIGSSNPYVNVFLLCSLVANAFLFVSLHRLWYHHRDLIASSRMAASGISAND